ncbi:MAG: flippase [Bacilli bacterium]|nr:flippase [Bacilli bacterium]
MKFLKKIKNNAVLSNISWIVIGRIIYMLLNFIVSLIVARYLGPSQYGLLGYAASYTTFFASICSLGINSIIVKELINNPKNNGEILGTSIFLRIISSILSFLIIIFITFIVDMNETTTKIIVSLYAIHIIFQSFELLKYWFQSKLQSKYSEIAASFAYISMAIYMVILLIYKKNVLWFSIASSIEYLILAISLYIMYKKKQGQKLKVNQSLIKRLLSESYHFIISGMMISIYNSTDRFMLKQMLSESDVAYYTTAVTISGLCTFLLSAIIQSLTPVIIESKNKNNDLYEKRNKELYAIVFYISTIISLFIAIFSKIIINTLYGESYLPATIPLIILTWYTAFSYLGVARDPWIVCEKKQNYSKYIYIIAAFVNIIINYALIPIWGASGAAFASLVTQIGTVLIFPLLFRDLRPNVKLIFEAIFLKNIIEKKGSDKMF